ACAARPQDSEIWDFRRNLYSTGAGMAIQSVPIAREIQKQPQLTFKSKGNNYGKPNDVEP
ncbi:MAG: hypothetical protein JSU70_06450, partial [Phycisphaerales bacterium]